MGKSVGWPGSTPPLPPTSSQLPWEGPQGPPTMLASLHEPPGLPQCGAQLFKLCFLKRQEDALVSRLQGGFVNLYQALSPESGAP